MQRFQRVLLAVGPEEVAAEDLGAVVQLLHRNQASLTLVGAVAEPGWFQQLLTFDVDADEVAEAEAAALRERLESLAASMGVPGDVRIDRGHLATRAVQRVLRDGHDLVVAVDRETPRSPEIRRLLRKCPCPVWVLRPDAHRPGKALTVVAAVNPVPDELDLNLLILQLASSMVERSGGKLFVVHAWEMMGSATFLGREMSGRFNVSYDELLSEGRGRHADALDVLLGELGPYAIDRSIHLEHGPAERVIAELVDREDADLLVMGSVGRSGVNGLLIGNTAERVLTESPCSLIAVKPAGFVSPISVGD